MAGFEGIKWANKQMLYFLNDKSFQAVESDARVVAVSRSIHYGLCLTFEGIRFFCKKNTEGQLELVFMNLNKNLTRFQEGIKFNLRSDKLHLVPNPEEMIDIFLKYFREPEMMGFLSEMADLGTQGYLRPFTYDEQQSIGVTFPEHPSIRAVACRYDQYLGEPFSGVVVPHLVRAVGVNGTGCLKLGGNYLISVKAVDEARKILPEAASALFLDDRPYDPIEIRKVTEWDSSCCLFALRDGTVIKIPESPLILPSVTIAGICEILREWDIPIEERDITYGELIERSRKEEVVAICSVGTAGILNRAQKLILVDEDGKTIATQQADESHELYVKLGKAKAYYWDIYRERVPLPKELELNKYVV